jgi:hypothetical protein
MGHGRLGGSHVTRIDKNEWLGARLENALRICAPLASEGTASLESTLDEVVEVGAVELGPTRDTKAEACVREEMWKITLPSATFTEALEHHTVKAKP